MNLGLADGVDLGWKLAGVLQGWGGDGLLASYEEERRAVHQRTIAAAIENYRTLSDHLVREALNEDTPEGERAREEVGAAIVAAKTREFKSLGVVLGSHYREFPDHRRGRYCRAARATHRIPAVRASRLPRPARLARRRILALRSSRPRLHPASARRVRTVRRTAPSRTPRGLRMCRSRFSTCARPASRTSMKRRSR